MNRQEFESLAMRSGNSISQTLYGSIELYYMSTDESKVEFVKRVFGGKVNTAKSIVRKISTLAIDENRAALRGNAYSTEERLCLMDQRIKEHYEIISTRCI